jgi:lipoprotein-releasing system permease protein
MSFEAFIARRYLFSKKKTGFITIITSISIIGVTIGVAALIVVLAVFNGFGGLVTSLLVGFDPHLRIELSEGFLGHGYAELTSILEKDRRIKATAPYISGRAMIISESGGKAIVVKGVDAEKVGEVSGLREKIVLGQLSLGDKGELREIVLGLTLSDRLGALVGDTVLLVSPTNVEAAITQMSQPLMMRFRVAGIYQSHNKEYDGLYAYVSLQSAGKLFNITHGYEGIEVRLYDIDKSDAVKRDILKTGQPGITVSTWYDLHRDLYSVMRIERWLAYIILSLIIGVATFNLLGSLTMSVIEKTRDIGVLKSMGSTSGRIVKIYLFEGIIVGLLGTAFGSLLGFGVCLLQQKYGLFRLDPTVYIIPAIPVELQWTDFLAVGLAAFILCSSAALYPARRAARLMPADAVRWE